MQGMARDQERAVFRLEKARKGQPTESHHVLGRFEHFKRVEERYLPPEEVQKRYARSRGFGAASKTNGNGRGNGRAPKSLAKSRSSGRKGVAKHARA
jgi:hypothetical protein